VHEFVFVGDNFPNN